MEMHGPSKVEAPIFCAMSEGNRGFLAPKTTLRPVLRTAHQSEVKSVLQFLFRKTCFPECLTMTSSIDFSTCDFGDEHKGDASGAFRVLPPVFRDFGAHRRFAGPVVTVQCLDDNSQVKALVEGPGDGRVLVVDGGASLRRALLGGNLGAAAARNGWAGVLVDGCVRDVAELAVCETGIRALASMPLPTERRNQGVRDVAVKIQGVTVRPGEWLYADEDGTVVADRPLHRGA
jgi:regulator of ribonuclease activity A